MAWELIAFALASLAASPVDSQLATPVSGNIIIRFRHPYAICAGTCPNYQIEIFANGDVARNSVVEFHAPRAKLEQFRSELDHLRPPGDLAIDTACAQTKRPDGSPDPLSTPRPDDVEVRWLDAGRTDQLTSCAFSPLSIELQHALRTLGIEPSWGTRLAH